MADGRGCTTGRAAGRGRARGRPAAPRPDGAPARARRWTRFRTTSSRAPDRSVAARHAARADGHPGAARAARARRRSARRPRPSTWACWSALWSLVVYFASRAAHVTVAGLLPSWPYLAGYLGRLGLIYAGYFTGTTGQTLGKIALGLRVVDAAGQPPGYLRALGARAAAAALGVLAAGGRRWLPMAFDPARRAAARPAPEDPRRQALAPAAWTRSPSTACSPRSARSSWAATSTRVRARGGARASPLELSGARDLRLWLDAGRAAAGLYPLTRDEARGAQDEAALAGRVAARPPAPAQAPRRPARHRRCGAWPASARAGARRRRNGASRAGSPRSPALTLAVDGRPWPPSGTGRRPGRAPADAPEREWDRVAPRALARRRAPRAADAPVSGVRAVLGVSRPRPGRSRASSPTAARRSAALRDAAPRSPDPCSWRPRPLDAVRRRRPRAGRRARARAPRARRRRAGVVLPQPTWIAARPRPASRRACAASASRAAGARSLDRRRAARRGGWRSSWRTSTSDLHGLPAAADLRRQAEALLAARRRHAGAGGRGRGARPVRIPSRACASRSTRALGLPANADRLFEKARRIERARAQVEARIAADARPLWPRRARARRGRAPRGALGPRAPAPRRRARRPRGAAARAAAAGPRHYLTSRGLSDPGGPRRAREPPPHLRGGAARGPLAARARRARAPT